MHPNPVFRTQTDARNIAFVRRRAFGVLAINGPRGPLTASVPILLSEDGQQVEFHLVRSNPIAAVLQQSTDAVLLVSGPDSYVSPDWYGVNDQVPTWNYVAVRLEGTASLSPGEALLPLLDRLSAHFETQLHPKPAWTSAKMDENVLTRLLRAIVPCRIQVSQIEATWKLNQNKPEDVRLRAASEIENAGIGLEAAQIADLMRNMT